MKTHLAAIATLFALAALLSAGAEAAPVPANAVVTAPDWSAGSEWHYSDGYAVKVASVSPKGAVFDRLDAPGQQFTRQGFIRTDSVSGTTTRNAIYRTIPDAAGASLSAAHPLTFQREYLNNGKLLVHASSWSVEGRETITVPAGTFDCWVIVWRTRSLRSDWTGFERWWYSPQAQNYVRMEYKYGPEPDGSRVLMTYNLVGNLVGNLAGSQPAALVVGPLPAPALSAPAAPSLPVPVPVSKPKTTSVVAAPVPAPAAARVAATAIAPPAPLAAKKVDVAALVRPPAQDETLPSAKSADVAAPAKEVSVAVLAPLPAKVELPPVDNAPAARSMPSGTPDGAIKPVLIKTADVKTADAKPTTLPKSDKLGSWHAQLGAAQDAAKVRDSLKKILTRNPGAGDLPSGVTVREVEGHTFYRAWLGSYENSLDARSLCDALDLKKARVPGCTVFKGATLEARAD